MDEPPPEAYDYEPEPFVVPPDQLALPGLEPSPPEPPDNWSWLDARFVGLEQVDAGGELTGYEIGCVDLYADTLHVGGTTSSYRIIDSRPGGIYWHQGGQRDGFAAHYPIRDDPLGV